MGVEGLEGLGFWAFKGSRVVRERLHPEKLSPNMAPM